MIEHQYLLLFMSALHICIAGVLLKGNRRRRSERGWYRGRSSWGCCSAGRCRCWSDAAIKQAHHDLYLGQGGRSVLLQLRLAHIESVVFPRIHRIRSMASLLPHLQGQVLVPEHEGGLTSLMRTIRLVLFRLCVRVASIFSVSGAASSYHSPVQQ
jgi:hypothetical protein